ncbi:hypothetical protein A2U01_0094411, partial [Trifolium medium]|nr:hypothetical protein [Trifolium medium]
MRIAQGQLARCAVGILKGKGVTATCALRRPMLRVAPARDFV